ncbi:SSI family serine proteinase inhibitor [Kitasatospora aureofaciens]|uniref:SSI family serine proteinase inhibitor n=1 Tax=Kitasatospora aureofaciens TaxID=1894 RepID=UPI00381EAE50
MTGPRLTAVATALGLLALAAPSAAAHPRPASTGNWLNVAIFAGQTALVGRDSATLHCPDDGTRPGHPHAEQACADLTAADGDVARITHQNGVCPMVYSAVTAKAYGVWNGQRVEYAKTFANDCVMRSETGAVFDFTADR